MKQLPTFIEYLLLNHDYVVIPGLGTFIVQQAEAHRNDEEEAFLPPVRLLRFNAGLAQDDTVLLDAIESVYGVSQERASQMLCTWVTDFTQTLDDEGYVEFGSIGFFSRGEDGAMNFSSQESGIMSPDYYGLDAFHFSEVHPERKAKVVPMAASMETDEKQITIRINRRVANAVVAACTAILLFMVFSSPLPTGHDLQKQSGVTELLVSKLAPAPTPSAPVREAKPETTAAAEAQATEEPQPQVQAEEHSYCIVMASAITLRNAQAFVAQLEKQGFDNARITQSGKMVRVVVGRYATQAEAYNAVRDIHKRDKAYKGAWVYYL